MLSVYIYSLIMAGLLLGGNAFTPPPPKNGKTESAQPYADCHLARFVLQGGYRLMPECYAHMTHMLSGLANGRVVLALEVSCLPFKGA